MSLLLDTHVLLWWLADSPQISPEVRDAIAVERDVFVSASSAWEIAIKKAQGRLEAPDDLPNALAENQFQELAMTVEHALCAGELPRHHGDPFDRMLVAQAQIEGLTLVTFDRAIKAYDVAIMPAGAS